MKRFVLLLVMLAVVAVACGCGNNADGAAPTAAAPAGPLPPEQAGAVSAENLLEGREIIHIRERMFMTQINDIYLNPEKYVGKGVQFEGIYIEEVLGNGDVYRAVVRMSPGGCCGDDGRTGFEVVWDDPDQPYPKFNDWVEVSGVLEQFEEDGVTYLRVRLVSLRVLAVRGAEYVNQ
ncbi:MAG: hypothetical protein FWE77_01920 [Clostridia bacterium]|nr:hypothetical protein [Clostridia bacterium]